MISINSNLQNVDLDISRLINQELLRQQTHLELIASENFTSKAVMEAQGSILTNKYAEGLPNKRYYGGCEHVDKIEQLAIDRAKKLFNAEWVNVQPHSGAQANFAVFLSLLKPGETIMGMDLSHGGHLTHGSPVNVSGKWFKAIHYGVDEETEMLNMEQVKKIALEHKPKLIICGYSAYPRTIDFKAFRSIADEVGAYLMADIAHIAGLVASGLHPNPVQYCDVVTTTTHKTLRGPRGGIIMMGKDFENKWGLTAPKSGRTKMVSELIDTSVMPGIQGGPLMHIICAKAVAFKEALTDSFKEYSKQVVANAKHLSDRLTSLDYKIVSGGTDTHLILIDLSNKDLTGKYVEHRLESAGITTNKNMVPFDQKSPMVTSGVRIGTPALTTRGMKIDEMDIISSMIDKVISNIDDDIVIKEVRQEVFELCNDFPLNEELDHEML